MAGVLNLTNHGFDQEVAWKLLLFEPTDGGKKREYDDELLTRRELAKPCRP